MLHVALGDGDGPSPGSIAPTSNAGWLAYLNVEPAGRIGADPRFRRLQERMRLA
jgi:hypothetical protein